MSQKAKKAPCSHRAYLAWPGATYGACTACGALLERRHLGAVVVYIPLHEPLRRPVARAAKPVKPRRTRIVQGVLFS